jgi:hypothetical protein
MEARRPAGRGGRDAEAEAQASRSFTAIASEEGRLGLERGSKQWRARSRSIVAVEDRGHCAGVPGAGDRSLSRNSSDSSAEQFRPEMIKNQG